MPDGRPTLPLPLPPTGGTVAMPTGVTTTGWSSTPRQRCRNWVTTPDRCAGGRGCWPVWGRRWPVANSWPPPGVELTRALDALAGSLASRDLGTGDIHELQLVEVLMTMGEFAEANDRASALWQPLRHPGIRMAAARALAGVHLAGGDLAGAHAWLDEAAARAAGLGGDLGWRSCMPTGPPSWLTAAASPRRWPWPPKPWFDWIGRAPHTRPTRRFPEPRRW